MDITYYISSSFLEGYLDLSFMVNSGLKKEEYRRKTLGILKRYFLTKDEQLGNGILSILQKGWPDTKRYIDTHKHIELEDFRSKVMKKMKKIVFNDNEIKVLHDDLLSEIYIMYFMCILIEKDTPDIAVFYRELDFLLIESDKISRRMLIVENVYSKMSEEDQEKIDDFIEVLKNEYGITLNTANSTIVRDDMFFKDFITIEASYYRGIIGIAKLEMHRIIQNVGLSEADIRDLCASYGLIGSLDNTDAASQIILAGIHLMYVTKLFSIQHNQYFDKINENDILKNEIVKKNKQIIDIQNKNKERVADLQKKNEEQIKQITKEGNTTNSELVATINALKEELENRIEERIKSEKERLEEQYLSEIVNLETQNKNLIKDVILSREAQEDMKQELTSLQDFYFGFTDNPITEENITQTPNLSDTSGIIFGGDAKWHARMRLLLPNWLFFSGEFFDLNYASDIDTIFFYHPGLSRGLYKKGIRFAKANNKKIGYIVSQNDNLV